jgi:hypothetical protein
VGTVSSSFCCLSGKSGSMSNTCVTTAVSVALEPFTSNICPLFIIIWANCQCHSTIASSIRPPGLNASTWSVSATSGKLTATPTNSCLSHSTTLGSGFESLISYVASHLLKSDAETIKPPAWECLAGGHWSYNVPQWLSAKFSKLMFVFRLYKHKFNISSSRGHNI